MHLAMVCIFISSSSFLLPKLSLPISYSSLVSLHSFYTTSSLCLVFFSWAQVMGYPIDHVASDGTIHVLVREESESSKKLTGVYVPKKDHVVLGDGFILELMTPEGGLLVSTLDVCFYL